MPTLSLLIVAAQSLTPQSVGVERVSAEVAAKRVGECAAGRVTVESDAELQEEVLVVAATGALTDAQIACIADRASFYRVVLPADPQRRLDTITEERAAALFRAESREWLAKRQLLEKLPQYKAGATDDAGFAKQIERICEAKGALSSSYGPHAVNPAWIARQKIGGSEDSPLKCVITVASASGFNLGFIGNEAFATPAK